MTLSQFSVVKSSDQTATSGVNTLVNFQTELYDVGNGFASDTWTPPAGIVYLAGIVRATGTISGGSMSGLLNIRKNGGVTNVGECGRRCTTNSNGNAVAMLDLANGTDSYQFYYSLITNSGNVTISSSTTLTSFVGHWIESVPVTAFMVPSQAVNVRHLVNMVGY